MTAALSGDGAAQWVDAGAAEHLLEDMLRFDTPSGAEYPMAYWLAAWAQAHGLVGMVDEVGNTIVTLAATVPDPQPPIILLGHADTVPGHIDVRRDGQRLYGRGAVDAKGPLAAFLAATAHARQLTERVRDIVVIGAVEEEIATSRGARHVVARYAPAFVVIGEPSGVDAITIGYKGRLLATIRVERSVAHTARPEASASASAVEIWNAIVAHADRWNQTQRSLSAEPLADTPVHAANQLPGTAFTLLQPSLRWIRSASDGFREWCTLEVGYRLPPGYEPEDLMAELREMLHSATGTLTGKAATDRRDAIGARAAMTGATTITFRGAERAFQSPRTGRLPTVFAHAIRATSPDTARHTVFQRKTGTSDMNVVGPIWQCPIIAYGPGDAALDHTPDEHIDLADFARGVAVLDRALARLVAPNGAC